MVKKNIILVGMPRSGTSMTTNIFAQANYFVAEKSKSQLRKGDEFNPSGYWEAQPLIDSNAEIFAAADYPYDNTWLYDAINQQQSEAIYQLPKESKHRKLVELYNKNSPWIWKDPRLCYTLAYWWPLMDPETTAVLLLKREPLEIYQSFLRVKWRGHSKAEKQETLARIAAHMQSAQKAIKTLGIPYLELNYADFKKSPGQTADAINEFFGTTLSEKDLGFDTSLDHSGVSGKLSLYLDRVADIIPDKLRKSFKQLLPKFLLKKIFPHRYN